MFISIALAALGMVGVIVQVVSRARSATAPGSLTLRSRRQPDEITRAARRFFRDGGWTLRSRSGLSATFAYTLRPSGPEVILLLLLGVLPGLLYLVLGRRSVTVTLSANADGNGSATVLSWSNSADCEQICRAFASLVRDQEPEPRATRRRPHGRRRRRLPKASLPPPYGPGVAGG